MIHIQEVVSYPITEKHLEAGSRRLTIRQGWSCPREFGLQDDCLVTLMPILSGY